MKISFVVGNLGLHGSVRRVVELSNALVARGHWVQVFTGDGEPCSWLPCAAPVRRLVELDGESHHAVVACHLEPAAWGLVERARCAARAFYLLALDERNLDAILVDGSERSRRFLSILRSPGWLVMANATWMWEWLRANLRPDAELLLGGVNQTIFHPVKVRRDPSKRVVLTSGRPRAREGSAVVKRAVDLARETHPELAYTTYWKAGHAQSEMAAAYCAADLFVDGQRYAGWNNPVAEAMACQVPVVCTDIGGVRDFAADGETALLVPVDDEAAMARAIVRLLEDSTLRARLVDAAYRRITTFTYAASAERLERLLEARL